MTVAAPLQRDVALAQANEVRIARAAVKRRLTSGELSLVDLLEDLPECMETARVHQTLKTLPWLGPVKAANIIGTLHISEIRKLGSLTEREKRLLLDAVWRHAPSSLGDA